MPWLSVVGDSSISYIGPGCDLHGSRRMKVRVLKTRKPQD